VAGIQLSGLASGLDTESLITSLLSIERLPRTRLTLQQAAARAREESLTQIRDRLTSLKTATDALSSAATWAPVQTASVTDATKASARVTSGVGPGAYTVNVTAMATAEQRTFTYTAKGSDQTYTLNGKALTITGNEALSSVVSRLNADTGYGVYAVESNGKLVLASRTTGTAGAISMSGGGANVLTEDVALRKPGTNAAFTIDGAGYTSTSNTISSTSGATGFIFGVELSLKSTGSFTVNVSPPAVDKAQVESKVKAFVDAYNSAMDLMRSKTSEKRVAGASNDADARKGALWADGTVRSVMDRLRFAVSTHQQAGNSTAYDELAEIGISTGDATGSSTFSQDAVNGKLVLDTKKLTDALEANPTEVQRLLGAITGENGFAQALNTSLTPYTQAAGIFDERITAAKGALTRLDESLVRMDERLGRKEESLRKMFTALEVALQRSQSQGAALAARLASLSSSND
jgi:flagellar hook-associated protein 2